MCFSDQETGFNDNQEMKLAGFLGFLVIDPTRSDTVSDLEADHPRTLHIRFRQSGDVLFNLAVARVVLENGREDRDT